MKSLLKTSKSTANFYQPLDKDLAHIRSDFNVRSILHGFGEITVKIYILLSQMIRDSGVIMLQGIRMKLRKRHIFFNWLLLIILNTLNVCEVITKLSVGFYSTYVLL